MKYAIMVNGVTELSMMKADVLSIFDTIQVCTHYLIDGNKVEDFPFDVDGANLTPLLGARMLHVRPAPECLKEFNDEGPRPGQAGA